MKSVDFRREREQSWLQLETLLGRADRSSLGGLPPDDLARLPGLYRAALASLAVARAISLDRALLEYLEGLCCRAWLRVYARQGSLLTVAQDFLVRGFPAAAWAFRRHIALSAGLLLLGILSGWLVTAGDITMFDAIVDSDSASGRTPWATTERLQGALHQKGSMLGTFAMFLFTHNARIGLAAAALGIVAGLPSALLLVQNGASLGAFAALYHSRDLGLEFWAWLLPHGITELLAVVVCGAAGLAIGEGLLFPGRSSRLRSAAERGRQTAPLVLGAVLLFFVAGLIEGIFRQVVHDTGVRLVVATLTAVWWPAYFATAARSRE